MKARRHRKRFSRHCSMSGYVRWNLVPVAHPCTRDCVFLYGTRSIQCSRGGWIDCWPSLSPHRHLLASTGDARTHGTRIGVLMNAQLSMTSRRWLCCTHYAYFLKGAEDNRCAAYLANLHRYINGLGPRVEKVQGSVVRLKGLQLCGTT